MALIIDRFESEWAVIEWNDKSFNFPKALVPKEAREGDVVNIVCEIDKAETEGRQRRIKDLEDELFRG